MKDYLIKASSEEEMVEFLASNGIYINEETRSMDCVETEDWSLLWIGKIYPYPIFQEETGEWEFPEEPLEGFHVNLRWVGVDTPDLSEKEIFPSNPKFGWF